MVVDKNHEIFSFKQSKWLEKYMNFNTQQRKNALNEFEKDFYKLLNNEFFWKDNGKCKKSFEIRIW